MRLEGLAVLCRVATEGSINGAARSLDIAPSTAWRRLQQLEGALGCRLLERTPTAVRLTQAGHEAVRHGETMLQEAAALREAALAADHGEQLELRVGMVPATALGPVLPAWERLQELRPGLRVVLIESPDAKHPLRDDFDLVVTHTVPGDEGLFVQRIFTQEVRLYASRGYAADHPLPLTPEAVADHPLAVHYLPPEVPYQLPLRSGGQQVVQPIIATTSPNVVAEWVRSDRGLGWVTDPLTGADDWLPVLVDDIARSRPVYLVAGLRQRDSARLRLVQDVLGWLQPRLSALPATPA